MHRAEWDDEVGDGWYELNIVAGVCSLGVFGEESTTDNDIY